VLHVAEPQWFVWLRPFTESGGKLPTAYYFTHTQVRVDPTVPVRGWNLSDEGRARLLRVVNAPWVARVTRVVASSEYRTVETAHIFAARRNLPVEVKPEIDDSKRPPSEFLAVMDLDRTVDAFFARPEESARPGWEPAADAQRRVAAGIDALIDGSSDDGDLLIIGHGRIGTLLFCHLAGLPISRDHFQPTPGGNLFAFDRTSRKVLFGWRGVASPL
jgi:broad specificity phosphatase PhoE